MEITEGLWKEEQWGDLVKQMGTHRGAGGSSRADGARCSWNTLKVGESGLVGAPNLHPCPPYLQGYALCSPSLPSGHWHPGVQEAPDPPSRPAPQGAR